MMPTPSDGPLRAVPAERARRVVAVIPLFNPDDTVERNLQAIRSQVHALVAVDDGSTQDITGLAERLARAGVHVMRSTENLGIAHALNRGIEAALGDLAADLVLTVDQDSLIDPHYVDAAVAAVQVLEQSGTPFLAVGAGVVNDRPLPGIWRSGVPYRVTRETNQSGLLFPAEALRALGEFDEAFFIDCVDTDYILRGLSTGRPTVLVDECAMQHALGEAIAVTLPPFFRRRHRRVPYHGPARRYYISRNRMRLVRRFALRHPRWVLWQTIGQARLLAADIVFGPESRRLISASLLGCWDGLGSRGGRISEQRLRRITPGGTPAPAQSSPKS